MILYSMGVDLNFTRPSVIVLIDKEKREVLFSESYTVSLIEPIQRVKRYLNEYQETIAYYDAFARGLIEENGIPAWPIVLNDKRSQAMLDSLVEAVVTKKLKLPFSGGFAAIHPDEIVAFTFAWYGCKYGGYPIEFA